jgi:hypothetical protein
LFLLVSFVVTGFGLVVGVSFAKQRQLLPPLLAEVVTPALALAWAALTWLDLTGALKTQFVRPLTSEKGTVLVSVSMAVVAVVFFVLALRHRAPVTLACDGMALRFGDVETHSLVDCDNVVWMSPAGTIALAAPNEDRKNYNLNQLERTKDGWYRAPEQVRKKPMWSCEIQSGPSLGDDPTICRASETRPNWTRAVHWKLAIKSEAWKRGFEGLTLVAISRDKLRNGVVLQSYSADCSIALGTAREDLRGEHAWSLDPVCWEGSGEQKTLTFDLYICQSSPGLKLPDSPGDLATFKMSHAQESSNIACAR